ncbi:Hypothetical predicted protein [Olea europaea subsp. europaea]|uniref:Uncharacterized protein n=1 Tax=Olea europaea subsp. europaea TaxID=158383 RepID=A0A8S0QWW9_OLEEU|nr:Hypothetical predicted protein [Olea europaea subsp. europaea]
MTQVDLETLVTSSTLGGNDSKITSETLAVTAASDDLLKDEEDGTADVPSDYPPESFWLSKDAEYDWFDRNAFYERKDSTKGSSTSTNLNSNSQRSVKLKSKALIIGLPKTQKTTYMDSRRRSCKLANARLFPNRSVSAGKSTVAVVEPSSPKVSCMGRVRSKRCRRRNNSSRKIEAQAEKSRTGGEKRKTGFYTKVMGMFRSKKGNKKPIRSGSRKVKEPIVVEPQRKSVSIKLREIPVSVELVAEPPGLGGMKRFSSGRRSECWTAEELNTAISESLDLNRPVRKQGA